jgi:putative transposase
MRKSKFSDEQITAILAEADRDGVVPVADRYGVTKQIVYVWRKRFGQRSEPPRRPQTETVLKQQLGEPVATDLENFCAAHYGAPAINVVREAVKLFIADQLARDPEIKKRFDQLRAERTEKSLWIREAPADLKLSQPPSSIAAHSSTDEVRASRRK